MIFIGVCTPFIYELILKFVQTLNELLQHVPVHVYHLQGEHSGSSCIPNATAKLLFVGSLVISIFVVDVDCV